MHCHVFLEEEVFCCIFNFRVKDEKLVLADIESCVDKMAKMYGNVFFVVGKSFAGMKNIKDCYQKEIKDMVNRQFYFKEKVTACIRDATSFGKRTTVSLCGLFRTVTS